MAVQADYVTKLRNAVTKFLEAADEIAACVDQYNRLDYGNALLEANFESVHPDVTKADVVGVITSAGALDAYLSAGHGTNLSKLRRLP